jgi:acetylornithine deacetylase/succinyl-diaminopimelate desuccinylase-like protein|tara:strand:+ start:735 stop:2024 length:1290 start_codon:yes stop_codon:yes gene_type:complete
MTIQRTLLLLLVLFLLDEPPLLAQFRDTANAITRLRDMEAYQEALRHLDEEYDRFVEELVQLTEIPAPPFGEEVRASTYMAMLRDAGLTNVEMDQIGNVMGLRPGTGEAPLLAVAAHLDTVFPEGTEVEVRREGNRLRAPGIGDDTAGLATLLAVARVLNETDLETESDLLFIGNVGEEGAGDLRGVKHLFRDGKYKDQIGGFISVESGGQSTITTGALGSLRYRVTFKGPGGHSYGAFGLVSPAYAMGNAIRKVSAISVPDTPKTTFNIGIVEGGTSVNSIPFETSMVVDMRSESRDELEKLVETFLDLVHEAVEEENATRSISEGQIELEMTLVGDRPSGQTSESANIVKFAVAAFEAFGIRPTFRISSTDSNVPISLGIPAITIGRGGLGGRSHSLDEWVDIEREPTVRGMQVVMTTILAIAGVIN